MGPVLGFWQKDKKSLAFGQTVCLFRLTQDRYSLQLLIRSWNAKALFSTASVLYWYCVQFLGFTNAKNFVVTTSTTSEFYGLLDMSVMFLHKGGEIANVTLL